MNKEKFWVLTTQEKLKMLNNQDFFSEVLELIKEEVKENIEFDLEVRKLKEFIDVTVDTHNNKIKLSRNKNYNTPVDKILSYMLTCYDIIDESLLDIIQSYLDLEQSKDEKENMGEYILIHAINSIQNNLNDMILLKENLLSSYQDSLVSLEVNK